MIPIDYPLKIGKHFIRQLTSSFINGTPQLGKQISQPLNISLVSLYCTLYSTHNCNRKGTKISHQNINCQEAFSLRWGSTFSPPVNLLAHTLTGPAGNTDFSPPKISITILSELRVSPTVRVTYYPASLIQVTVTVREHRFLTT
jgi:hypothetical protein